MRDKLVTQLLGMTIDVEAKLQDNRNPGVFWPDLKFVVATICPDGVMHKAILRVNKSLGTKSE